MFGGGSGFGSEEFGDISGATVLIDVGKSGAAEIGGSVVGVGVENRDFIGSALGGALSVDIGETIGLGIGGIAGATGFDREGIEGREGFGASERTGKDVMGIEPGGGGGAMEGIGWRRSSNLETMTPPGGDGGRGTFDETTSFFFRKFRNPNASHSFSENI